METWHGTPSGYTYHRCRCEDCKRAQASYALEYRKDPAHPERLTKHRKLVSARGKALARLGQMFPDEYQRLYLEERAKASEEE